MEVDNRNYTLDFIRGLSALIVMAGHLRIAIFKDYSELINLESSSILNKGFYFITGLGHQAVMVFFVLSGYFVGGSVLKSSKKFSAKNYLIARISRLWTPLFPVLILTFIIDYFIGIVSPELLQGDYYSIINSGPRGDYSIGLQTFISNIFFLQTIYSPVYGSNGALWSLAYEFWYYILFPLCVIILNFIPKSRSYKVVSTILLLLIINFIASSIFEGFLIWLMGVAVYIFSENKILKMKKWFIWPSLVFFIFELIDSKFIFLGHDIQRYSDILVGLSFSIFLIMLFETKISSFPNSKMNKISYFISEISYTLYIVHFPIVLLIYALFYSQNQLSLNINSSIQFSIWMILIILISTLLWYIFEKNTWFVRKKMKKFFNRVN
ncbi:acyltransferase [Cellulophaga sp. HaHaR_3_176]|uniref:acyltransferase family protein n=1 Tax=Cellulophaga sp. HaHaR_3_176 TaxID=1942464 RepID=UPI001C1FA174|nr:acyltransferase [Cellulophaga sp. HaHaR_3_176]QWX83328.1 acyltransferase [Cellulophaga sp. HaHaR_3_176]